LLPLKPTLLSNRLRNVSARTQGTAPWNAHEWDVSYRPSENLLEK